MKTKFAVVCALTLVLVGAATPAQAFLGDDLQTVAARYGKPVGSLTRADGSQPMLYNCEGYRIIVDFEDGRSVSESFRRLDRLTPFSEDTLRAFLLVHSSGRRWRETERISGQRGWSRDGALALYDERSVRPTLIISSINFVPVGEASSRVLAVTPLPEWTAALEAEDGPQTLALGNLETGQLETGHLDMSHLETGSLQTGSLQTSPLQIGKLGDHSRVR